MRKRNTESMYYRYKGIIGEVRIVKALCSILAIGLILGLSFKVKAATTDVTQDAVSDADKSSMIASDDEKAPATSVGSEDMIPIYAKDVNEGSYDMEVESSSSMFRIVACKLNVTSSGMSADITLGGTGYLKLYMGTGQQAVEADESEYSQYNEGADGAYTYTVPVEALNKPLECTGFSKKKEKWYDHQICFMADTLPDGALKVALKPVTLDLKDGKYKADVTLTGGSGKATIESPAELNVSEGAGTLKVTWSSPNYDYMVVHGVRYEPVNTTGNSVFEIPLWNIDEPMTVIADTTAMSTPHEIEYDITVTYDGIKRDNGGMIAGILIIIAIIAVAVTVTYTDSRKKKQDAKDKQDTTDKNDKADEK